MRHVVRHRLAEAVQVAAEEQHLVRAGAAVEAVAERRDERALRPLDERQPVGDELEDVVAALAEEQVARLAVEAAA